MRSSALSALVLAVAATQVDAVNIVLGNDDGWAEINIRETYRVLTSTGNDVLISAPAKNKSGSSGLTGTPEALPSNEGCEFDSCPAGSPAVGYNQSEPHWNYVNSYPATAVQYGIETLSAQIFNNGKPDLVVTGVNVGSNLGVTTRFSGTVGAAQKAASLGVPAIAFSGDSGSQTAWNVQPVPDYSTIYAEAAATLVNTLVASGTPYLPEDIFLNINFPAAGANTDCTSASDVQFVLSRIYTAVWPISGDDAITCNNKARLPSETSVVDTEGGCYASVSVTSANDLLAANQADQTTVLNKLASILHCLP